MIVTRRPPRLVMPGLGPIGVRIGCDARSSKQDAQPRRRLKSPSSARATSPPSCQGLALASTSCRGKGLSGDTGSLFLLRSPRLRLRNSWMPGPRPGMTNGVRMEQGLCSRRLNLTPMGLGPGIHEFAGRRSTFAFAAPQLVDARPKAWHDERGADGAGAQRRAPKPSACGPSPGRRSGSIAFVTSRA